MTDDDSLLGDWELDGEDEAAVVAEKSVDVARAQEQRSVALVAVFDASGQPVVARTVMDGGVAKRLEDWRTPTPDEYNALMWGGKIVKGGVVGERVPAGTRLSEALQRVPLGAADGQKRDWKKIGLWTVGTVVALGGGYYAYRKWSEARGS